MNIKVKSLQKNKNKAFMKKYLGNALQISNNIWNIH